MLPVSNEPAVQIRSRGARELIMAKSILPILCLGLILCIGIIPASAAITDSGSWGWYSSGTSDSRVVLLPGVLERIERAIVCSNVSEGEKAELLKIQAETKPQKDESLFPPLTVSGRPLYKPDSIIVRFKPDVAGSSARLTQASTAAHTQLGATVATDYSDTGLPGMQVLHLPEGVSVTEAVRAYSQNPDVLYAEPNYYYYTDVMPGETLLSAPTPMPTQGGGGGGGGGRIPNDPEFGKLWGLHNTGQTINGRTGIADADIDAPEAWCITTGSRNVTIAVIDTGVMYTHPDLAANIWRNPGEIPGNGIDDDNNGYIDDIYGWDFYDDDNDPADFNGHGTHCAGTIAGVGNNAEGVAGVMWDAEIMPLRFMGPDGTGYTADAVLAIQYATMMGADIISCSWGGGGYSQALKDAIDATPALVVCATGNDGTDNDAEPHYPSSYTSANLLAVAASNSTEQLAWFSNIGATSVDVVAPGENILSTCITPDWVTAFYDPMDSLNAWDADAPWDLNTVHYVSPPSSADGSSAGNYEPKTNAWLTTKKPIDLRGLQGAKFTFSARWELEMDRAGVHIISSLSPDDNDYDSHGYITGSSEGKWCYCEVPLSMYDENPVYIGFALQTDDSIQKGSFFIDDVRVEGIESISADYKYISGTSMATPQVSGVAGLIRSVNTSLSATEIKDIIINTVDKKPAYAGKMISGGRVNAYEAVRAVVPVTGRSPSIVSNKDTVIRSYSFVVTISGEASRPYWLYIKDAGLPAEGNYPLIVPNQVGVTPGVNMSGITDATGFACTGAQIDTNAGGTRMIQFNTTSTTSDQNFTITVVDPTNITISSDVVVTVKKGSITLATSGTGIYYIGDEITLFGTNTDGYTTYLFLTGPNLANNGVMLSDPGVPVVDGNPATFTGADVEINDTWHYRWNAAYLNRTLDAGNYTIYAASTPRDRAHLSDAVYTTATIQLQSPTITAGISNATLVPGDECRITGVAGGAPPNVIIWMFGPNYYGGHNGELGIRFVSVEADGAFKYTLKGAETYALQAGQYYVVIQHPVDQTFGVMADTATGVIYGEGIANVTLTNLQPLDAATALITALDSPNIDDIYARLTFEIASVAPQAYFTADITNGTVPLTVRFTDHSIGSPANWSWSFGDGAKSTAQNPVHTYTAPGNYTVSLTTSNADGSDTMTRTSYITVTVPPPVAVFAANVTAGVAPLTVQFTDTSAKNPSSWFWDFGDGNTSTIQNPIHTYTAPGNHTITLSINGNLSTVTMPGYIKVTPVLFGDANENGRVNQADTLTVLQQVVGIQTKPTPGTDRFRKTDVNVNGEIDVGDALFIAQHNVGLRDVWFTML